MNKKDEKKCPLCGELNACQAGTLNKCWCQNIKVPEALLEKVPEEKKGKVCICYSCIEEYLKNHKFKY